jgi:hypothetical protein
MFINKKGVAERDVPLGFQIRLAGSTLTSNGLPAIIKSE